MGNNPDGLSEIHIQASVDLAQIDNAFEINSADNNIWKCHAIDLSNYRNADFLQIGILGATEDWRRSVMIDNLRIFDQLAKRSCSEWIYRSRIGYRGKAGRLLFCQDI